MQSAYHFFDCRASFGMRAYRAPGSFYKKEDLLKKMRDFSIDDALVYHSMAKEYDPQVGNRILTDELKNEPHLHPVWVAMPDYTGEFETPECLLKEMKENGVRAITMFPSPANQNYSFAEFTCGKLLRMCEEHRIPLFLDMDQIGGIQAVDSICSKYPELPLVVTKINYRIDRDLYPLMEKYRSFYIETSGYKVMEGISQLCAHFGAERLLFGTGMPETSGGAAVGLIAYADIPEREKEMIASANLKKLLGGVQL